VGVLRETEGSRAAAAGADEADPERGVAPRILALIV
jgi:hypothetical protein